MPGATKQRNVRVTEATYQALRELAAESGEPLTAIVGRAVERHRRERLLAKPTLWQWPKSKPSSAFGTRR